MERSTTQLAMTSTEAAGLLAVHPSTVKRWCNDGDLASELTPGGHRRISVHAAMDFARDRGIRTTLTPFHPFEPHVWNALRSVSDRESFDDVHALAIQWARRGDFERLEQLLLALGRSPSVSFCTFVDEAVRGLLAAVGRQWQSGRMRVGDEHMVSQAVTSVLLTLRREWFDDRPANGRGNRPVAVVGTLEGNHHSIGALCVRILLERSGWLVYYPGPDVPVVDFAMIQRGREASLVCISLPPTGSTGDVAAATSVLAASYDRSRPYALAFGGARPDRVDIAAVPTPFTEVGWFDDCGTLGRALESDFGRPEIT